MEAIHVANHVSGLVTSALMPTRLKEGQRAGAGHLSQRRLSIEKESKMNLGKIVFFGVIGAMLVAGIATNGVTASNSETRASTVAAAAPKCLGDLRDEGIKIIGYVAGNTMKTPLWPELRPMLGEGGDYYDAYLRIKMYSDGEWLGNRRLYQEWFTKGESAPFDESDALARAKRLVQLNAELSTCLKS